MAVLFLLVFRFLRLILSGHQAVALEKAALRMQIAVFERKRKQPLLSTSHKWSPPIRCGARPGFMANSRCSVSPSPSALSHASRARLGLSD
jgi:hypothetical protein